MIYKWLNQRNRWNISTARVSRKWTLLLSPVLGKRMRTYLRLGCSSAITRKFWRYITPQKLIGCAKTHYQVQRWNSKTKIQPSVLQKICNRVRILKNNFWWRAWSTRLGTTHPNCLTIQQSCTLRNFSWAIWQEVLARDKVRWSKITQTK
jgi:hypothetical protein